MSSKKRAVGECFNVISKATNMDSSMQSFAVSACSIAYTQESDLKAMAKLLKGGFDAVYGPSFHVVVCYKRYFSAIRHSRDNGVICLQQNMNSVAIGKDAIVVLIFRSAPNKYEGATRNEDTSASDVKVSNRYKVFAAPDAKGEAYALRMMATVDEVEAKLEKDKGDWEVELVSKLRDTFNVKYGPQWHVVASKLGDMHVEYSSLYDDFIELKSGKTFLVAWRHSQPAVNILYELLTSVPVVTFLMGLVFILLWFTRKDCKLIPCPPADLFDSTCDDLERTQQYNNCKEYANAYLLSGGVCMVISMVSRFISSNMKKSAKNQWLLAQRKVRKDM